MCETKYNSKFTKTRKFEISKRAISKVQEKSAININATFFGLQNAAARHAMRPRKSLAVSHKCLDPAVRMHEGSSAVRIAGSTLIIAETRLTSSASISLPKDFPILARTHDCKTFLAHNQGGKRHQRGLTAAWLSWFIIMPWTFLFVQLVRFHPSDLRKRLLV